jgi:hypothetical protein
MTAFHGQALPTGPGLAPEHHYKAHGWNRLETLLGRVEHRTPQFEFHRPHPWPRTLTDVLFVGARNSTLITRLATEKLPQQEPIHITASFDFHRQ